MGKTRHNFKHFDDEYDDDYQDVRDRKKQDQEFRKSRGRKDEIFNELMKYEAEKE